MGIKDKWQERDIRKRQGRDKDRKEKCDPFGAKWPNGRLTPSGLTEEHEGHFSVSNLFRNPGGVLSKPFLTMSCKKITLKRKNQVFLFCFFFF